MDSIFVACRLAVFTLLMASPAAAICPGFGPQTPRAISNAYGRNPVRFGMAPPASEMQLCNIHTHTNAEHMGPGVSIFAGDGDHGGFKCAGSNSLTDAERTRPKDSHGGFHGVEPGDTIEVHWVYSTCNVGPGKGLGACLSDGCANPQLRVESQVFLVVNDPNALNFLDFAHRGTTRNGLHQPRSLPTGTGAPVVFRGSTTGTAYDQTTCSPLQVTWSVRPRCARLDTAGAEPDARHRVDPLRSGLHRLRHLGHRRDLLDRHPRR